MERERESAPLPVGPVVSGALLLAEVWRLSVAPPAGFCGPAHALPDHFGLHVHEHRPGNQVCGNNSGQHVWGARKPSGSGVFARLFTGYTCLRVQSGERSARSRPSRTPSPPSHRRRWRQTAPGPPGCRTGRAAPSPPTWSNRMLEARGRMSVAAPRADTDQLERIDLHESIPWAAPRRLSTYVVTFKPSPTCRHNLFEGRFRLSVSK